MRTYTTKEAAAQANRPVTAFRAMMTQLRQRGGPDWRVPGLDSRTPLWNADEIDAWAAALPGNAPLKPAQPWQQPCMVPGCRGHHSREDCAQHATQLTEEAERLWSLLHASD